MLPPLAAAALLLCAAALLYAYSTRASRAVASKTSSTAAPNEIPGLEPSDPELGNLGDVGREGSLHAFLCRLHGTHGPVASFYWQKQRVVSLASADGFKAVSKLFDRPKSLFALFEPMIGSGSIQYANGADGRARRRAYVDPAFTHAAVRDMYWSFERVASELVRSWAGRGEVPLHEEMMMAALRSITSTALGGGLDEASCRAVHEAYTSAWHEMEERVAGSFPEPGGERERRFDESLRVLHDTTARMAAAPAEDGRRSYIDALAGLGDEARASEVITMLVGGSHTTGNSLTWALYFVARHPAVQQRVADELRAAGVRAGAVPTFEEARGLEYLGRVIKETLRLSVLAPWAARVSPDADVAVGGGHVVEAGTPILLALGAVLTDANVFERPDEFDPDRFARRGEYPPIAYSPFGFAGGRVCPGVRYAQWESVAILGAVLAAYQVSLPDAFEVAPVHGLVTSPAHEIPLRLAKRA